jgi:hypothetical protein
VRVALLGSSARFFLNWLRSTGNLKLLIL